MSTATLEERIYQRQILKEEVAAAVVDRNDINGNSSSSSDDSRNFTPGELKKIFLAPHDTNCDTYDLITQMKRARVGSDDEKEEEEKEEEDGDEDWDEDVVMRKEETSKSRARRENLFPLYTGPADINDRVLRSVVQADENGHVTFVRTTSTGEM